MSTTAQSSQPRTTAQHDAQRYAPYATGYSEEFIDDAQRKVQEQELRQEARSTVLWLLVLIVIVLVVPAVR